MQYKLPSIYLRKIYWVDIGQIVTKIIPINFEANSRQKGIHFIISRLLLYQ